MNASSRISPRLRDGIETLLLALLAAAPVLASAVRAAPTWRPVGDTAAIALRASDVVSRHSPMVGMPTTLSDSVGQAVHHPGPLEFWLIAAGQLVFDHRIMPMAAVTAMNVAAVVTTVWIAGWLGGRSGRLLAALALVLCTWSLRGEILIDPYNPYAAWLPLGAFAVALVAVVGGRLWALPVAVLAGSYASQAHVSLVVPVTVVTVAASLWALLGAAERHGGWAVVWPAARRGAVDARLPLGAGVLVLAMAWLPVALDMAVGRRNLWILVGAAGSDEAIFGWSNAWQVIAKAITDPPWLTADRTAFDTVAATGRFQQLLAVLVLGVAVAVAVRLRRRRSVISGAVVIAVAGLFGGMLAASRMPDTHFSIFALHNFLWLWPFTALLWVSLLAGVADLARARLEASGPSDGVAVARVGPVAGSATLAVVAIVAIVGVVQAPVRPSVLAGRHAESTMAVTDQVAGQLQPGSTVLVDVLADIEQSAVAMGMVLELERRGFDARVPQMWEGSFGSHRVHWGEPLDASIVPLLGFEPVDTPFPGWELVAGHDPDATLTADLVAANEAIIARIDEAGGLELYDGSVIEGDDARGLVVRGDLLGLERLGLVVSPQIPEAEFSGYARLQEGPVLYVRVFEMGLD